MRHKVNAGDALRIGKWLQKAQSEGINSAGGLLVPDEIAATFIALRELRGAFRAAADVRPMHRDALNVPRRLTGTSTFFPLAEGAAITESQTSWDSVGLVAKKLGVLVRASNELNEDSAIDVGVFLASEAAYNFADKEDAAGFNGDGSQAYGGIRGVTTLLADGNHNAGKVAAASGHNTFATLDNADLTSLIAKLPGYALSGARWFISSVGYAAAFCRLAAVAGGISWQNGAPVFLGFPVSLTQVLPITTGTQTGAVMLLFGDLSLAAILGDRRSFNVRRTLNRYAEFDQVAWQVTERIDINVHDVGDNTNPGPVVGLVGTA